MSLTLTHTPDLHGHASRGPLSRADFEGLCLLRAVSAGGCGPAALAHWLGLSPALGPQLGAVVDTLIVRGLVQQVDETWALTEAGRYALVTQSLGAGRR